MNLIELLVTASLIGISVNEDRMRLEWDTNKDGVADLRVYYFYNTKPGEIYTSPAFMYQFDKNYDGVIQDDETFPILDNER